MLVKRERSEEEKELANTVSVNLRDFNLLLFQTVSARLSATFSACL